MLSQYNGRGNTSDITITPFPNMGDGLYGYVQFSINNNPCFSGSLSNIEGESKTFNVYPKYVTLNGKDDTVFITVDSTCEYTKTENSNEFSITDGTNGFTIKSDSNVSFENQEVIVKNCDGLIETVYVSQNPSQETNNNMLSVNPQYITLNGENKTFSVNVISVCNDSNTFTVGTLEGISLSENGNTINGTIISEDFTSGSFTVSNECGDTKEVNITYNKTTDAECSILINGETSVTYTFTADTMVSYDITSSSNWGVYSYDSTKVRCSKSGNKLNISLSEDKNKTDNKEIILKNREGCEARVIYSIESGLVSESGITFTFKNNSDTFTTALTQNSSSEDILFDICVFAHDNDDNEVEWRIKSSTFSATTSELKGGKSSGCKTVTLKATEATKKSKNTSYIIKLQEQETYKEITVKVTITRPQDEATTSYDIQISPESGLHSKSEMNGFQISVTPTYVYNGNTYYIGNNATMMNDANPSYKGVSAITESNTNGVTLSLTNDNDVYDTLVYDVNIDSSTLETLESFEICTTATTKDGTPQTVTDCTTISLTASTVEVTCNFTTGKTSIEIGGESQTIEEVFYSQIDGEKVDIDINSKPDWVESVTLDEYGERLYIKVIENDSFEERNGDINITQNGGECEGEYIISIKQYNNKTIFIPDFDYLVIRYIWTAEDGDDLDTVTVASSLIKEDGSTIEESELYSSFLGKELGWSHSSSITDANNNVLLDFAGDNTDSGTECVYINFKNICSEEQLRLMVRDRVNKIHVDLYGNWFASRIAGNLDVELVAYKGGTMSEPINFNFINEGGEEVYNSIESTRVCVQGQGVENAAAYETTYTKIGYVEYNITNGNAMLSLNNAECDESSYILMNIMPSTSITIPYQASSNNYIEFISSKENVFFDSVTVTSSKTWLTNLITNSVSNPMRYYYTVTEFASEEETERKAKITVLQGESNKTIEYQIIQESKCGCSSPETVNATAIISVKTQANGKKLYENNGSYFIDVICDVILDKTIVCGSAIATIYYGLGSIDNAGFSEVEIPNGSYSGTSTIACSCGVVNEYDENKPMDCISSARTSHSLVFTNNRCYVEGVITASVDSSSLCQPCICDVTSVSVTPNSYKYTYDGEEKIFTLKVETDTCESCTKGYKLYDPNGSLVTAGNGENTVTITYATAVKGDYILKADDDTSKTAKLTIDKFGAYYVFCIRQTEEYVSCYSSTTITYSAADPSESYNIIIRSRYYTSDTEYTQINFTRSVDVDWITLNNDGSWKLSANNTYNERQGIITYTQETTNNKVYLYIKQSGKNTSWELTATGTTIDPPAVEAYVTIKSLKNEQPYSAIMFSERCDWVTGYYLQSSSNGIYTYQFTTLANSTTSTRTCTVTAQQEGGLTGVTFDIVQRAAEITTCMKMSYVTSNLTKSVTISYQLIGGTQEGTHTVSSNGTQDMCFGNIGTTTLKAVCNDSDITLSGDVEFEYTFPSTAVKSITVTQKEEKPIVTRIKILNNCPGPIDIEHTDPHGNKQNKTLPNGITEEYNVPISGASDFQVSVPSESYNLGNNSNFVYVEFLDSNGNTINATPSGSYASEGGGYKFFPGTSGVDRGGGNLCATNSKYQSCGTIIFVLN